MASLRSTVSSCLLSAFLFVGLTAAAQTADIQKTFETKYALTKPTADRNDIVTAGDVIILQKDGLQMCGTVSVVPSQNIYKNGKITQSFLSKARLGGFSTGIGRAASATPMRTFVTGEKFWITSVDMKEDGVVFGVISDPISDIRYYATLKIPFNKDQVPSGAEIATLADQVFKVQPGDGGGNSPKRPAPQAAAAPPPPMAAIAPPPPPADAAAVPPPTIKVGETKADVTTAFGAPTKVVKLATKEIDFYPDMKVTFVHDKVANVE